MEVTTPSGKKATLKDFITARDSRELELIVLEDGNADGMGKLTKQGYLRSQDETLKLVVTEFDGSAEKILDRILDLPKADYDAIRDAAIAVISGPADKKKDAV